MSITNVQLLHDLAETAVASYAELSTNANLGPDLRRATTGADFTERQAEQFTDKYDLIVAQPNVDLNGFSAAVFVDKNGTKVLALRGTEFGILNGQIGTDFAVADLLGIGGAGYANLQGAEMYRYWRRLTTPGGQNVAYSDDEIRKLFGLYVGTPGGSSQAISLNIDAFKAQVLTDRGVDSGTAGQSVIAPGERVNVTGHSLGGHLALLFARFFPGCVNEVVTLNAPTFPTQGDIYLNSLGFPSVIEAEARITRLEADGDVVSEVGNVDPGTAIRIAQENFPGLASIGGNHSSVNGVDGLAVMNALARLDSRFSNDAVGLAAFIRAAANDPGKSYENALDAVRRSLLGTQAAPTPVSVGADDPNRIKLYDNIAALGVVSQALEGRVTLRLSGLDLREQGRSDFGALVALLDLSTVVVGGKDAAANAELASLWQSTRTADYAAWQADRASPSQTTFTNDWIADRATLLEAIVARNIANGTGAAYSASLPTDHSYELRWVDAEGTQQILIAENAGRQGGTALNVPMQLIAFDGSGGNTMTGTERIGFGDHLYGGAGDDTLYGLGGDDYLEGDAGADTLDGGRGDDDLNGGAGFDTYLIAESSGHDTVIDDQGVIKLAGRSLTGAGELVSTASATQPYTVWLDDSNASQPIRYSLNTLTSELTIAGAGSSVVVKSFASGDLGINVPAAAPQAPLVAQRTFDLGTSAGRTALAALTLEQRDANLRLDNAVFADGSYLNVSGNAGNDTITGGAAISPSGAILNGGGGNDRIWAGVETTLQAAIAAGETGAGNGRATLMLAGNQGDDTLVGGAGDDVLFGGTGDDTLVGGAGADIILADGDNAGYEGSNAITAWSSGSNTASGPGRMLRMHVHSARVGATAADSAGQRVVTEHYIDVNVNPLGNTSLSGLLGMQAANIVKDAGDTRTYLAGTQLTFAQVNGGKAMGTNVGSGADIIYAGAGDDTVNAGAGDDFVFAGTGNDAVAGYEGNDFIEGGAGADTLWGDYVATASQSYDRHTEFGANWGTELQLYAWNHGSDVIDGGDGNDTIHGGGRADELYGGSGDDVIFGDDLGIGVSDAGDDYLDGGDGNDTLDGGAGSDQLLGGNGNDQLAGGANDDRLFGGSGNDVLHGDGYQGGPMLDGNDSLDGGDGDDELYGWGGNDVLRGGAGRDTLSGGPGNDTYLFGRGDGQDVIKAIEGTNAGKTNVLQFDSGIAPSDLRFNRIGNDLLLEIRGTTDSVTISSFYLNNDAGNTKNPIQRFLFSNGESLESSQVGVNMQGTGASERIDGSPNADSLRGGGGNDVINGYAGNDYLDGGAGNDQLIGDEGDDIYVGGGGSVDSADDRSLTSNDAYRYQYGDGQLKVRDDGGFDTIELGDLISPNDVSVKINSTASAMNFVELIFKNQSSQSISWSGVFDAYTGRLVSNNAFERIKFADGTIWSMDDVRTRIRARDMGASAGDDKIYGFESDDVIDGGLGNDLLEGMDGNDTLIGGAGNDFFRGAAGNDVILGGDGDDGAFGGSGNDTLVGGKGNDSMSGQQGNDIYRYDLGDGNDWFDEISDGASGFDIVEFGPNIDVDDVVGIEGDSGTVTLKFSDGGSLQINNMYAPSRARSGYVPDIEELRFSDGSIWTPSDIQDRIQVMTGTGEIIGTNASQRIDGGDVDDVLVGGRGNDTLDGGLGADTYIFGMGDGQDVIQQMREEDFFSRPVTNILKFDSSVQVSDVRVRRVNSTDVEFQVGTQGDRVLVRSFYTAGGQIASDLENPVHRVQFSDGNVWTTSDIHRLAMSISGTDAPAAGGAVNTANASVGDETYLMVRGQGARMIAENDATTGNKDTLLFDSDIATDQLWFRQVGDDLEVSIIGTSDAFTLDNWFLGDQYHVEVFETRMGSRLLDSDVQYLVQAMASFSPPAAGQTTLPSNYRDGAQGPSLYFTISSTWK